MCTIMLAAMDTTIVSTAVPQIAGDLGGFRRFSYLRQSSGFATRSLYVTMAAIAVVMVLVVCVVSRRFVLAQEKTRDG